MGGAEVPGMLWDVARGRAAAVSLVMKPAGWGGVAGPAVSAEAAALQKGSARGGAGPAIPAAASDGGQGLAGPHGAAVALPGWVARPCFGEISGLFGASGCWGGGGGGGYGGAGLEAAGGNEPTVGSRSPGSAAEAAPAPARPDCGEWGCGGDRLRGQRGHGE